MDAWLIYSLGFLAQLLFSSRMLFQWLASEKQKKVVTVSYFWEVSLFASFLLFVYGYLRHDFAIMLGQVITYYIYIRNIQLQGEWHKRPGLLRWFILLFPVLIIIYTYNNNTQDLSSIFNNRDVPLWLLLLGSVAQVLFTLRFVYQWWYSEKIKQSALPLGFWVLSLAGSGLVFIYAVIRKDPVLMAGHIFGLVVYARNILILKRSHAQP